MAVYEKTQGNYRGWEVVKIRIKMLPSLTPSATKGIREEYEAYPSSEEWGSYGWTPYTKERAFELMDELVAKEKAKST